MVSTKQIDNSGSQQVPFRFAEEEIEARFGPNGRSIYVQAELAVRETNLSSGRGRDDVRMRFNSQDGSLRIECVGRMIPESLLRRIQTIGTQESGASLDSPEVALNGRSATFRFRAEFRAPGVNLNDLIIPER